MLEPLLHREQRCIVLFSPCPCHYLHKWKDVDVFEDELCCEG